ncbi:hypothetical protein [Massilia sp. DWR3-1-1]|uniref:hypothetical protein n=1 Tax=Massilia sp. DWR3-1-1 TaxID=2804559 RepID=UPI003CF8389E
MIFTHCISASAPLPARCIAVACSTLLLVAGAAPPTTAAPAVAVMLTPASCEFAAVQAVVALARTGQTVNIPAGTCDWGTKQLSIAAGIALKGAGIDATILQRSGAVAVNTYLVRFDCGNGKQANFSGMTLAGANLPYSEDRGLGLINGCVDFRVSNAKFTKFVFAGIEVRGAIRQRGVIYNSQFIDNYNATVHNLGYGVVVFGDGTWPALELGSANAVFVEDNYMSGNRHHIAANNGARYVFRRNTAVANTLTKDFSQVDAHGLSSAPRGTRSWEIYDNTFSAILSAGRNFAAIGIRGGDGVVFHNTYTSNIAYPVALLLEGAACGTYPVQDQISQAYIAESISKPVTSLCEASIALNREYFLTTKDQYKPYTYPHPLRQN